MNDSINGSSLCIILTWFYMSRDLKDIECHILICSLSHTRRALPVNEFLKRPSHFLFRPFKQLIMSPQSFSLCISFRSHFSWCFVIDITKLFDYLCDCLFSSFNCPPIFITYLTYLALFLSLLRLCGCHLNRAHILFEKNDNFHIFSARNTHTHHLNHFSRIDFVSKHTF